MNKKNTILFVLLCCAAMLRAQFNVPTLSEFDYTPIYDQKAATAISSEKSDGLIAPFQDDHLQPFFADAATPGTASIPNTDGGGAGTGVIPEPIADCLWLLAGLALVVMAFRVRRVLKEE